MAKVFIEETTLTAIGDAIREKTGGTGLIAPGAMPNEIKGIVSGGSGGGGQCNGLHIPEEALVISRDCSYRFAHNGWNWFIELYSDKITTKDILQAQNMFQYSDKLSSIPLELNFTDIFSGNILSSMFTNCTALVTLPILNNTKPGKMNEMFYNCYSLKSVPDDWTDSWDWSYIEGQTNGYDGYMNSIFYQCVNLRRVPAWFFLHNNPNVNQYYCSIYNAFNMCLTLERVEGIRLPANATWTSNAFNNTFNNCARLKSVTFALQEDGSPYVHNIKNQTIDLTTVGYLQTGTPTTYWNLYVKDITEADKIDSWQKWETYFGDTGHPSSLGTGNGYAVDVKWCTFGRTAAKRLFATLPDVTGGSGNTIKLNGRALLGNNQMPYEAINDLTEEEIAVATARGWTVTRT